MQSEQPPDFIETMAAFINWWLRILAPDFQAGLLKDRTFDEAAREMFFEMRGNRNPMLTASDLQASMDSVVRLYLCTKSAEECKALVEQAHPHWGRKSGT